MENKYMVEKFEEMIGDLVRSGHSIIEIEASIKQAIIQKKQYYQNCYKHDYNNKQR